jgi:RimJ/RimL family protein N-acetyltransferase
MELRDGSIVLRPWNGDDAAAVYEACQDREIQHWISIIPRPYTLEHARAFVASVDPERHQLAIVEDGRVVATRALRRLCRHALDELGFERLELFTDPDNVASQRVAEKTGFQREGVLRSHLRHPDGRRRDSVMFSLLPGELR